MVEAAGPDVRVYAVSAHGMGPLCHASWNLPDMLDYWGYGRESNNVRRPRSHVGEASTFGGILRMVVPGRLQYAVYAALPRRLRNKLLFRFYRGNRSWDRCRAFAVPNNDLVGAIRINLKGRDHNGTVEPGMEYEQVCDDICEALAELKDPVTGQPVIKNISRFNENFGGHTSIDYRISLCSGTHRFRGLRCIRRASAHPSCAIRILAAARILHADS